MNSSPEVMAAQNGATFLDGFNPLWFTRISSVNLDLSDTADCVVGQLYDSWSVALEAFAEAGIMFFAEVDYGVSWGVCQGFLAFTDGSLSYTDLDTSYRALTDAWLYEINRRL